MAKFTPAYLKKLEDFLKESGYEVRYEKGNFKSNYCILEAKKVVVVNKFSVLESRIQSLLEIVSALKANNAIQQDLKEIGLKNPIQKTSAELFDFESNKDGAVLLNDTTVPENTAPTETSIS